MLCERFAVKFMFLVVFILMLFSLNLGFSLQVSPGSFTVQLVPLGYPQDLGIPLVVQSEPGDSITIKVLESCPDDICPEGYEPIPNSAWYIIEGGEHFIADAGGIVKTRMWTNLPADESLVNRHFSVFLEITTQRKGTATPVLMPVFFVETASDTILRRGNFSIAPSLVEFGRGKPFREIALYNGDVKKHSYIVKVFPPETNSSNFPNLSYSCVAGRDKSLTIYPKTFSLQPYQTATLTIHSLETDLRRKELLVFIERDDGKKRFVRVRTGKD